MMRATVGVAVGLTFAIALSACGETAQTSGTARKSDGKVWETQVKGYDAPGYKPADHAAWEQQMRTRATGQNEYAKDR